MTLTVIDNMQARESVPLIGHHSSPQVLLWIRSSEVAMQDTQTLEPDWNQRAGVKVYGSISIRAGPSGIYGTNQATKLQLKKGSDRCSHK